MTGFGTIFSLLCTGAAFLAALFAMPSLTRGTRALWSGFSVHVSWRQRQLFRRPTPVRFALLMGTASLLAGWGLCRWMGALVGILGGMLIVAVSLYLLRWAVHSRVSRFEHQLVGALRSIAGSARAGLSLPEALEVIAREMPKPLAEEVGLVLRQYHLGSPLEEVLAETGRRLKSEEFQVVISSLILARRSGGEAPQVFEETASALEEMHQLRDKVKSVSAQAQFEAYVLAGLAPLFLVLMNLIQPDLVAQLLHTLLGQLALVIALGLELLGITLMRKLLSMDL